MHNYKAVSQRSMRKEMQLITKNQKGRENPRETIIGTQKRIIFIGKNSEYIKYAKYIVGKLVKIIRKPTSGGSQSYVCSFMFDEDRKRLNMAAGWSDNKREYLFDSIKFK